MAKLNGAWAATQLFVAIATFALAFITFWYPSPDGLPTKDYPRDVSIAFWPAVTAAAGLFFLVAFWLFARGHPDGRIVALFGLAIFLIANVMLTIDRYSVWTECFDAQGNAYMCGPFRGDRLFALVGGTVTIGAVQGAILLFMTLWLAKQKRQAAEAEMATLEAGWQ